VGEGVTQTFWIGVIAGILIAATIQIAAIFGIYGRRP
jgi:hypothetical protein